MADDDVDSIDDGERYQFAEDAAFPAAGEKKPVAYAAVTTMVLPGTHAARAGGALARPNRRISSALTLDSCILRRPPERLGTARAGGGARGAPARRPAGGARRRGASPRRIGR